MFNNDGYYYIRLRKDIVINSKQPNQPSYLLPKHSIQLAAVARFKSDSIATPMLGAIIRNPANLLGQPSRTLMLVETAAKGAEEDDFEIILEAIPMQAESQAIEFYEQQ